MAKKDNGSGDDLFAWRHVHGTPKPTEVAAVQKVLPSVRGMKLKIFQAVGRSGEKGVTPDEFCTEIHGLINTVRRRFTDLWKDGFIKHHPDLLARPNGNGNQVVAYVLGKDGTRRRSRIERLRDQLQENGITPIC